MTWWLIPLALAIGALLGMLGGGGAILTVPVLVYLVGQDPKAAGAGSLVVVTITSTVGALTHSRAGNVRVRDGLVFAALGTVGSVGGSLLARGISDALLMSLFAVLMFVVAAVMLRRRLRADAAARAAGTGAAEPAAHPVVGPGDVLAAEAAAPDDLPAVTEGAATVPGPAPASGRRWLVLVLTATGVGLLTGFFGVGGGFAVVPALVLALGYSMPQAVGTSLLVIVVNSLVALATRATGGMHVAWDVVLPFAVVAACGTFLGARLGKRLPERGLAYAFVAMLVGVGCLVAAESWPRLLG